MLVYRRQPRHCLPVPSQRMPGTSCSKLSTHSEEGRGEGTSEWETNRRHRGDAVAQWKFSKVNKCAQFVRQATIVCLREAHLPVCVCVHVRVCQRTCLCARAQGQIASQGLKTSAYKVLGAYGDRRWICCSLDGFTLHNKGFPSFFFFHFSSHTLCPLIPAAGVNRYLLPRFNATYGSNISSEK